LLPYKLVKEASNIFGYFCNQTLPNAVNSGCDLSMVILKAQRLQTVKRTALSFDDNIGRSLVEGLLYLQGTTSAKYYYYCYVIEFYY